MSGLDFTKEDLNKILELAYWGLGSVKQPVALDPDKKDMFQSHEATLNRFAKLIKELPDDKENKKGK